jgi:hypothetical protein
MAKGKAPNYFFVTVSPLSVLTGNWISTRISNHQKIKQSLQIIQWVVVGFIVFIFGMALYINLGNNNWLPVVLIMVLLVAIVFTFRIQKDNLIRVILISLILTGTINVFLNVSVIPNLYNYQGARQALNIYEQKRAKNDKIYNFELEEYELFFMAKDSVHQIRNWDELYKVMGYSGTWLYTDSIKYNDIIKMNYDIDTVYQIRQKGMNRISLRFLDPTTRESTLNNTYLIKTR